MTDIIETGLQHFTWQHSLLIVIALTLIYLGIARKMGPLLLVTIGFGMLLVNLPLTGLMSYGPDGSPEGLLARFYEYGIVWDVIPPLMFLGLGALTD
ncbi:sodium ion-translocating decarboxylase subunit beta, partial [Chloroflexota bacterium]